MNYRHIYHAGNFADVLKHAVFARLITYLQKKEAAFRILDTHAGTGQYDLSSAEAQKTGEWQTGIGRLLATDLPDDVAALLAPYLDAVRAMNATPEIATYPGSPKLARMLMRKQDRLSLMELHEADFATLQARFAGDHHVRATKLDGWLSLAGHLPPKERRGLVLVDPPFEKEGEFERLVDGLAKAYRRFATGTYCLWYPLKKGAPVSAFHGALEGLGIPKTLCAELSVRSDRESDGLIGSGLVIVNPPYTLKAELNILLPFLKESLAQDRFASQRSFWIAGEQHDQN
ncbi:23S rRNA (adenine(2030)-N(6))-methyltransferase RlmJ [Martelella radicis]|uniref:Ribosomal RNA large subunit methyltransferase J n=1 Tax=Martelella radicis TaxID=1397476 RepID=A0A7W6PAK1_9HYPH|nr:23S rRNA (adenine(2030)-N(6))-methyltransferase RlmJ [Martelella radicis]MBB4121689.1 23S rRNA (adenine2030-N6)-methyltransferase [Martelella radicis]